MGLNEKIWIEQLKKMLLKIQKEGSINDKCAKSAYDHLIQ